MTLPPSFMKDGFVSSELSRRRRFLPGLQRPGILIGTEGETNTGKTEFILSCPSPGIVLAVDRMYDAVLDNPNPPASRRDDFAFKEVKLSMATMAEDHKAIWQEFYKDYTAALKNPDARTIGIDGDSDTWETQRLAEFGKLTQVPSILYVNVNASRRVMIARAYDSGKVVVATNKVKYEYVTKRDDEGNAVLGKDGKEIREKSGDFVRQGFEDDNYLWHIQLRHLRKDPTFNKITGKTSEVKFGIRILKCKNNPGLKGEELWGDDCNFAGLVSLAYPDVELSEWGL